MTTFFSVRFNLMPASGILNSRNSIALKLGPSSLIRFIVRILVFYDLTDSFSDTNSSTHVGILRRILTYWSIFQSFNGQQTQRKLRQRSDIGNFISMVLSFQRGSLSYLIQSKKKTRGRPKRLARMLLDILRRRCWPLKLGTIFEYLWYPTIYAL